MSSSADMFPKVMERTSSWPGTRNSSMVQSLRLQAMEAASVISFRDILVVSLCCIMLLARSLAWSSVKTRQ